MISPEEITFNHFLTNKIGADIIGKYESEYMKWLLELSFHEFLECYFETRNDLISSGQISSFDEKKTRNTLRDLIGCSDKFKKVHTLKQFQKLIVNFCPDEDCWDDPIFINLKNKFEWSAGKVKNCLKLYSDLISYFEKICSCFT